MVFELKHEVEDNQNGEIHILSSCFQINKNKIFTINIHEYLKRKPLLFRGPIFQRNSYSQEREEDAALKIEAEQERNDIFVKL